VVANRNVFVIPAATDCRGRNCFPIFAAWLEVRRRSRGVIADARREMEGAFCAWNKAPFDFLHLGIVRLDSKFARALKRKLSTRFSAKGKTTR